MSHTLLARTVNRVIASIDRYANDAETGNREEITTILYNLHNIFPQWLVMTCPVHHKNYFYISNNCEEITGYDQQYLRQWQPGSIFQLVHEDDVADLHTCFSYCETIVMNELPQNHVKMRCIFNYRLRHADGRYLHVHDEKACFKLKNGSIVYFCMIRDISQERAFAGVKVEMFKQNGSLVKLGECYPSKVSRKLSPREQDLIVLIRQGLTTKEIAYQLNISHNTVRNIRSKMFEKYQVNNVVELLNRTFT